MYAHVHSCRRYYAKDSRGRKYHVFARVKDCEVITTNESVTILGTYNGKKFEIELDATEISRIINFAEINKFISLESQLNVFQRKNHLNHLNQEIAAIEKKNSKLLTMIKNSLRETEKTYEN